MLNHKGPRIDPCGIPNTISSQEIHNFNLCSLSPVCKVTMN